MPKPEDSLVAIRTCYSRPEAEVLRSLLEAYGVPVYIHGGELPGASVISEVAGGFHVMVPALAERDALAILEAAQAAGDDAPGA